MFRSLLFLLSILCSTNAEAQRCGRGPHGVGFTSLTRFDDSRPAVKEQLQQNAGRIIPVNLWYPAARGGRKMCFSDYVTLAGLELDSTRNGNTKSLGIQRYYSWPQYMKADSLAFVNYLSQCSRMMAVNGTPKKLQDYPVVLLVHGSAADHAWMAENLASHGFIVVHVPVKGSKTYELDYADKGLENQVLDYEFALKTVMREFAVKSEPMAAIGFSFGGQSAVALALRNRSIRKVVSLDGGIGSTFGAQLLKAQSYYDEANLPTILHLYNNRDKDADVGWLKTLPKTTTVALPNMEHGYFTSFGKIRNHLPDIMGKDAPDPGGGYEMVICRTTEFLM